MQLETLSRLRKLAKVDYKEEEADNAEEVLFDVRNLKVYYYTLDGVVKAVDDVSLKIYRGETLSLVGESGCGKSTLSLALCRLVQRPGKIVGGQILYKGREDILKYDEKQIQRFRGSKVAIVFQDPTSSLNPVFRIGDQIVEAITLHQMLKGKEAWERSFEALSLVKIPSPEDMAHSYPHQYSAGMRQRAMIALALSCNPDLIIADEPTSNLDVTIQAQILLLLKELKEKLGTSILLVTHDLGVTAQLADRVAVMYAGKIVEIALVEEFYRNPLHPYSKALLGAIPPPHFDVDRLQEIKGDVPSLVDPPEGCRFHPRCEFAMEICSKKDPKLVKKGNREVACFLFKKG
ncbi:MAG TPA: ABC transporter ATP-binding protein [Candidatus Korarchaeota archaeon]|nr:ABC transporter ATP-binding protein [Candidatus Korarchaeota archaeon]